MFGPTLCTPTSLSSVDLGLNICPQSTSLDLMLPASTSRTMITKITRTPVEESTAVPLENPSGRKRMKSSTVSVTRPTATTRTKKRQKRALAVKRAVPKTIPMDPLRPLIQTTRKKEATRKARERRRADLFSRMSSLRSRTERLETPTLTSCDSPPSTTSNLTSQARASTPRR